MRKPRPCEYGAEFKAVWNGYLWSVDSENRIREYVEAYDQWAAEEQAKAQRKKDALRHVETALVNLQEAAAKDCLCNRSAIAVHSAISLCREARDRLAP